MKFSKALVINILANQFVTCDILDLKVVIKKYFTRMKWSKSRYLDVIALFCYLDLIYKKDQIT